VVWKKEEENKHMYTSGNPPFAPWFIDLTVHSPHGSSI
jgi:hypothetical protein